MARLGVLNKGKKVSDNKKHPASQDVGCLINLQHRIDGLENTLNPRLDLTQEQQLMSASYEQSEIARYTDNGAIAHEGCTVDSNEG